jgi:hypothetical protein
MPAEHLRDAGPYVAKCVLGAGGEHAGAVAGSHSMMGMFSRIMLVITHPLDAIFAVTHITHSISQY